MDKNKNKKTATTEAQNEDETLNVNDTEIAKEIENEEGCDCKEQIADLENKYRRVLADYQNLEKRTAGERRELILFANKNLLLKILPVFDTLLLSEKHLKNDGLAIVIKQFSDVLKSEGVEKIETKEKKFDPHTMECIETVAGDDGEVIEEVQTGYMLGEKVLRVALVKVGKENSV